MLTIKIWTFALDYRLRNTSVMQIFGMKSIAHVFTTWNRKGIAISFLVWLGNITKHTGAAFLLCTSKRDQTTDVILSQHIVLNKYTPFINKKLQIFMDNIFTCHKHDSNIKNVSPSIYWHLALPCSQLFLKKPAWTKIKSDDQKPNWKYEFNPSSKDLIIREGCDPSPLYTYLRGTDLINNSTHAYVCEFV